MTDDQDPALRALFDQATRQLEAKAFTDGVMLRINKARRWSLLGWASLAIALIACAALLTPPLVEAVSLLSRILPASLIDVDDAWLGQLLSPINSLAGLFALTFLALLMAYRKIFA